MEGLLILFVGRKLKTSKIKTITKLAIARIGVFKNQRQTLHSQAKSDVVHLLKLGHKERALIRAEQIVKEQNMMDAFTMIQDYCYLLLDGVMLLKTQRECHFELKEVISSLIFASSRCAEFPELQKLRKMFGTRFGKEFAARAVGLRNNCAVSPKIIQRLSTRQPSLESKLKALQDTASENGIVLHLVEDDPIVVEERREATQKQKWQESYKSGAKWYETDSEDEKLIFEELIADEKLPEPFKSMKKYRDAETAALEAFESAAYAAEAARAAVRLSRLKTPEDNGAYHNGNFNDNIIKLKNEALFGRIYPIENTTSESEDDHTKNLMETYRHKSAKI